MGNPPYISPIPMNVESLKLSAPQITAHDAVCALGLSPIKGSRAIIMVPDSLHGCGLQYLKQTSKQFDNYLGPYGTPHVVTPKPAREGLSRRFAQSLRHARARQASLEPRHGESLPNLGG